METAGGTPGRGKRQMAAWGEERIAAVVMSSVTQVCRPCKVGTWQPGQPLQKGSRPVTPLSFGVPCSTQASRKYGCSCCLESGYPDGLDAPGAPRPLPRIPGDHASCPGRRSHKI